MVSTRTKTNSLPEKTTTLAETQAAAAEEKRKSAIAKPKHAAPKAKVKPKKTTATKVVENSTRSNTNSQPEKTTTFAETQTETTAKKPKAVTPEPRRTVTNNTPKTTAPKRVEAATRAAVPHPATVAPSHESATTFFDVPPELRNQIYAYALLDKVVIPVRRAHPYVDEPALLAVNQQVRSEALPIWYGDNIFEVDGSSPAVKFLRSMSDQKLRSLRTLRISCTLLPTIDYALDRIRQLSREFGQRGLSKQAVCFLVDAGGRLVWANLNELKRLAAVN